MFHQKNRCFCTQIWKLWVSDCHGNGSMFSNKIDIFIGKIACTVRMFRHGEMLLLPHARRIAQHRDGTRRGNSHFRSTLCSALDLASFPSGRTSVLGLELGTRLWFLDWITGEITPLSLSLSDTMCLCTELCRCRTSPPMQQESPPSVSDSFFMSSVADLLVSYDATFSLSQGRVPVGQMHGRHVAWTQHDSVRTDFLSVDGQTTLTWPHERCSTRAHSFDESWWMQFSLCCHPTLSVAWPWPAQTDHLRKETKMKFCWSIEWLPQSISCRSCAESNAAATAHSEELLTAQHQHSSQTETVYVASVLGGQVWRIQFITFEVKFSVCKFLQE